MQPEGPYDSSREQAQRRPRITRSPYFFRPCMGRRIATKHWRLDSGHRGPSRRSRPWRCWMTIGTTDDHGGILRRLTESGWLGGIVFRWRRPGAPGLATGYFLVGFQPGTPAAVIVTDRPGAKPARPRRSATWADISLQAGRDRPGMVTCPGEMPEDCFAARFDTQAHESTRNGENIYGLGYAK